MLPAEIVDAIVKAIADLGTHRAVRVLLTVFLSQFTSQVIAIDFSDTPTSLIRALLRTEIPVFSTAVRALKQITFSSTMDDATFQLLADSGLSERLLDLDVQAALITDDTAHCWKQFSCLTSLKVGGLLLTMTTYEQMFAHLRSLSCLGISTGDKKVSAVVLEKLLSPTSIASSSIREIHELHGLPLEPAVLHSLLQTNPSFCLSAQRISGFWPFDVSPAMLFELCPNLTGADPFPLTWEDLKRSSKHMKNFRILEISHVEGGIITQQDIDWIAASFPSLTSLSVCQYHPEGVDIGSVTSLLPLAGLQHFFVNSAASWNCWSFPPNLETLDYDSQSSGTEFDFSKFSECLSTQGELHNLRRLCLLASAGTPAIYGSILKSLPKLEFVHFENCGAAENLPPFHLSHPSLREIVNLEDTFGPACDVVLGELPHLSSCQTSPKLLPMLCSSRATITEIEVWNLRAMEKLEQLRLLPSVTNAVLGSPLAMQLQYLGAMKTMAKLHLLDVALVPPESLSLLLKSLPRLGDFTLGLRSLEPTYNSFEWLQHDELRVFDFTSSTEALGDGPVLLRVADSNRLPSLAILRLRLAAFEGLEIRVENLVWLEEAEVQVTPSPYTGKPSSSNRSIVGIRDCPAISTVSLSAALISALQLRNLPSLKRLSVVHSSFNLNDEEFCVDAPSLRQFSMTPARHESEDHAEATFQFILQRSPLARRL